MWECFANWNALTEFVLRIVIIMTRSAFAVSWILLNNQLVPVYGVEATVLSWEVKTPGASTSGHNRLIWEDFCTGALDLHLPSSVSAPWQQCLKCWPLTAQACQAYPSSSRECCLLCQMSPAPCSHLPHNTPFKVANFIPHDVRGTVAQREAEGGMKPVE